MEKNWHKEKELKIKFRDPIYNDLEGVYIFQTNHVNGKPFWLQSEGLNAIWYVNHLWMIGNKATLGKMFGRIHSKDSVGPLEASTWMYNSEIYHDGDVKWIETTDLIKITGINSYRLNK